MKHRIQFLVVVAAVFSMGLMVTEAAKEGEWVRIPSHWLLSRFVRASSAPAHSYKVALAVPAGSKQVKIVQSSGSGDVDELAGSFALESILNNSALKTMGKTKELYFQFVVTPPMLDIKMRTKEGQNPPPPGHDVYMPTVDTFYMTGANQGEPTSRKGKLAVIFPPEGGHASEALVTLSTGNPAIDRYFLHAAALNWQTTLKSSAPQIYRDTFGASAPTHSQSILDR